MKVKYKVVKRKNKIVNRESALSVSANVFSFILVAKVALAFRECAKIISIAESTGCKVEIVSGSKSGNSESILSLIALEISADKTFVLTIKGKNSEKAFKDISKVVSGEITG